MGWENGQVDYGPAPIYADVIYAEDDQMINALRNENDKLIKLFENTFINSRAWTLVAYTLANSTDRRKRTNDEINDLHKQARDVLIKYVKKHGFMEFNKKLPPAISLEP